MLVAAMITRATLQMARSVPSKEITGAFEVGVRIQVSLHFEHVRT
jgi:hypothetical protein